MRVTHYEFRLGVRIAALVKQFHRWHLATLLGNLDTVAEKYQPVIEPYRVREQFAGAACPQQTELIQIDCCAMNSVQQVGIQGGLQPQCSYDTGHAQQIPAHAETGNDQGEPEERSFVRKGGTKSIDGFPPEGP